MITRREITLRSQGRGFHLVTRQIEQALDDLPNEGLLHLFLRHTSAGLTINENADPSVRDDFETFSMIWCPNHIANLHTPWKAQMICQPTLKVL
jgi:secondary thiamine-phosphate synthase enzyme